MRGASLLSEAERVRVRGVEFCDSPWECPHCADQLSRARCATLHAVAKAHKDSGGSVLLLTFTVRHAAGFKLGPLVRTVTKAYSEILTGRKWMQLQDRFGITGHVRCLEVTHGVNGWHPHIHASFFTAKRLDDKQLQLLTDELWARWHRIVTRRQFACEPTKENGLDIKRVEGHGWSKYLNKMGLAVELTRPQAKRGRLEGHRTPWQILADAGEGDERAIELWSQWCNAMKGIRALTWSRGLREKHAEAIKLADVALDQQPLRNETLAARISPDDWTEFVQDDPYFYDAVCDAALEGGQQAVDALIAQQRAKRELRLHRSYAGDRDYERGRELARDGPPAASIEEIAGFF